MPEYAGIYRPNDRPNMIRGLAEFAAKSNGALFPKV